MKNENQMERLLAERWPKLRKRAQHETDPDKLIEIIEEIDDLLFLLEMRIARAGTGKVIFGKAKADSSFEC